MRTTNKFRNAWRQHILIVIAVCVCFSYAFSQTSPPEPANFFHQYVGLTDKQIDEIREGRALAKILNAASADQVLIFGAVHIEADPESYLKFATDISELQKLPGYLAVRKFSDPPQPSDMEGFTLVADDIKDLKKCKPDDCEFQLPSDAIEEFQRSINWSSPTVEQDVNQLAQSMALDALKRYQSGGNTALGTYRDKKHPAAVAEAFQALLAQSKAMPVYLPELHRYLLEFPQYRSPDIQSEYFWEKVNFGLKPTIRIVQAIVFRDPAPSKPAYALAIKQLYSSHYFQTALDSTVCIKDASEAGKQGFYLITLKGSQQAGLTGLKGSIVRKIAVDKSRSSLEKALAATKQKLEAGSL